MNTADIARTLTRPQREALLARPPSRATWGTADLYCVAINVRTVNVLRDLRLIEPLGDPDAQSSDIARDQLQSPQI